MDPLARLGLVVVTFLLRDFAVPLAIVAVVWGLGWIGLRRWLVPRIDRWPRSAPVSRPSVVTLAEWSIVSLAVIAVMAVCGAYGDVPVGGDTWGHLAKVRLLADDWPHVAWNASWYSGTPYFAGSYPPGYHLLVMGIGRLSGISDAASVQVLTTLSLIVLVGSAGNLARTATGRRSAGRLAMVFALAGGAMWSYALNSGLNPRLTAMAAVMVSLDGCARHIATPARRWWLTAVLGAGLAAACHLFIAGLGVAIAACVLAVGARGTSVVYRLSQTLAVCVPAVGLNAYFYLPMPKFTGAGDQVSSNGLAAPWDTLFLSRRVGESWILRGLPSGLVVLLTGLAGAAAIRRSRSSRVEHPVRTSRLTAAMSDANPAQPVQPEFLPPVRRSVWSTYPAPVTGALPQRPPLPHGPWHVRDPDVEPLLPDGPLRLILALLPGVLACLVYAYADHLMSFDHFVMGMFADDVLIVPGVLLSVVAAVAIAVAAAQLSARSAHRLWVVAGALAMTSVVWLAVQLPGATVKNRTTDLDPLLPYAQGLTTSQFRVAGMGEPATKPLNLAGAVPQTRGYQANAVIRPDFQYLIETATAAGSEPMRRALFDWWSVGSVVALAEQREGYRLEGDRYRATAPTAGSLQWFEVVDPLPLVWSSDTPTMLMVGDQTAQLRMFRNLVGADARPHEVMFLRGPSTADELNESWLAAADIVVIEGDFTSSRRRVLEDLTGWVERGGTLYVEQSSGPSMAAPSTVVDLLPVTEFEVEVVEREWNFDQSYVGSLPVWEIAPPLWGAERVWEVRSAQAKPGAEVLLSRQGRSLLIRDVVGQGSVIWSGFNLGYHADLNQSPQERDLIRRLLVPNRSSGQVGAGSSSGAQATATTRPGDTGVYFATNRYPNWQVRVDGRRAHTLEAGPGFMWVPLPDDNRSHSVSWQYRLTGIERLANLLSLVTLGLVIAVATAPWARWRRSYSCTSSMSVPNEPLG